jgi:acyl-coenzyme A thioesterase PaaI-like protein
VSDTPFDNPAATPEQVTAFSSVLDAVHAFHDALATAAPDPELLDRLAGDLRGWADTLAPMRRPETERLSGYLAALPVRGHLAIPPVLVDLSQDDRIEGTLTFGPFFLGGGGAAHGGVILTVFDEVLGVLATAGGKPARTAYLKSDFRSPVPLETSVRVRAWIDRVEGRKRFIRADMWVGETLCAEVDSLFVELREKAPETDQDSE